MYFGTMALLSLLAISAIFAAIPEPTLGQAFVLLLLLIVPASEVGVAIVNKMVTALVPPRPLAKLDYRETGIAPEAQTAVVVPTLFGTVAAVREALEHLEVQYLANPDPALRFAVLSDFTDAASETLASDAHIVDAIIARRSRC